jgi:hypothetical protein
LKPPWRQRGFNLLQLVGGLIVLALAARFAWWVATEESFDQVAAILWAIGFGVAYAFSADDVLVARVPAGFGVFALIGLASLPLSWLAGSTVALLVLLAAQLAFSFHAGNAISIRRRARGLSRSPEAIEGNGEGDEGGAPLGRNGDLVASFGQWVLLSFGALIFFLVGPLVALLVVSVMADLSQQEMKFLAAAWGLFGITWYGYQFTAVQWRGIPACGWIYLPVTAGILIADVLAGPFAEGTGVQVAYIAMPGALIAAFVEVFIFGGGPRNQPRDG